MKILILVLIFIIGCCLLFGYSIELNNKEIIISGREEALYDCVNELTENRMLLQRASDYICYKNGVCNDD